jgi:hypothetical protein
MRTVVNDRSRARGEHGPDHDDAITRLIAGVWAQRDEHQLPDAWNQTVVTLLHKKNDRNKPENFRPISLMSCAFKIVTRALLMRIKTILPKIINPEQHAFVDGREGIDAVAQLTDTFCAARDPATQRPDEALALFQFDFTKAYDTISRDFIFQVLRRLGFSDDFSTTIRRHILADHATMSLVLNGRMTRSFTTTHGIRQGDCLSTVLYIIAVSPIFALFRAQGAVGYRIPAILNGGRERAILGASFADDVNVLASSDSDVSAIDRALDIFGIASGQIVSGPKSNYAIVVDRQRKLNDNSWPDIAQPLTEDDEMVLLGFPFDAKHFYPNMLRIADRAVAATMTALAKWHRSSKTLAERAVIFGVTGRAKLSYFARIFPFPDQFCAKIDRIGAEFIDPFTSDSIPLPNTMLFGDSTIGGLSNNGIGTTRARTTALLARRAIAFAQEPPGSWRHDQLSFAWTLAQLQLERIVGIRPTLAQSMPIAHLFGNDNELIDPALCSMAWSMCAADELQLRCWPTRPVLFDEALSARAWRSQLLGGGPRPNTLMQVSCNRVIHLFSSKAWLTANEDQPHGGPINEMAGSATVPVGKRLAGVTHAINVDQPRSGLAQSIDWLRRHSGMIDSATRALRHEWSPFDLQPIKDHFTSRVVVRIDTKRSNNNSRPLSWVNRELGVVVGVILRADANDDNIPQIIMQFRKLTIVWSEDEPQDVLTEDTLGSLPRAVLAGEQQHAQSATSVSALFGDRPHQHRVEADVLVQDVPAELCWRVDIDDNGRVFLLTDLDCKPETIKCPNMNQKQQMSAARLTHELWEKDEDRPSRGAARTCTIKMAFDTFERSNPPKKSEDQLGIKEMTTSALARRARQVELVVGPHNNWKDRDRSGPWSRFRPWIDARDKNLRLPLEERDFVRRLMTDHFQVFPLNWKVCPCCGISANFVGPRHLVFECSKAILVRDEIVRAAVVDRDLATQRNVVDAWVWRLRPCRYARYLTDAAFRKRLFAIQVCARAQRIFRRSVWSRFGDEKMGVQWFASPQEEQDFSRKIAEQAVADVSSRR